ncbi:MAG TPA: adenylate/guanylate cyclase domain-containing protein [Burkholderiales bacterium]|nr:adenylate/guanylate cyclase domain-containing protein [Burkholderiales bacterium]
MESLKKHAVRIGLGLILVVVFLLHAGKWIELPLIGRLEAIVYDTRLELTMPRTVDDRIVILDIDEKSLAEKEKGGEGHWPWPRDRLGALLDELFDHYQITIVGFDAVFAERDQSSGWGVLQQLAQKELRDVGGFQSKLRGLQPQLDYDGIFAAKMRGRPIVLGYTFSDNDTAGTKGALPAPTLAAGTFAGKNIDFRRYAAFTANLPELQQAAASAGHFNLDPDDDGILRRVPMLVEFNGAYYEPLSLAIVRMLAGSPSVTPEFAPGKIWSKNYSGLEWLNVGSRRIPVDEKVTALIPYRGGQRSFKYISVVDVLHERVPVGDLKGKIVLVGTTAPGLLDLRATPVGSVYPGVEVHANMISGMLDNDIKQKPPYVIGAEFMLVLLAGVTLALLLPTLSPLKALITTSITLLLLILINVVVFHYGNLVLPLASALVMVALLFALNMSYGFFVEDARKRLITGLFGQYVPPELVDEMAKNPEQFSMAPRAQELSVLFSDVRGFTTISESLSPEDLAVYINEYLTTMSLVIRERHRGTLDKYIGDAIMAFWGAPLPDPAHARNSILAALDMQQEAVALNEKFKARGWPTFRIGIGINTGVVRVGDMGSQIRRAYTVMGDAVNLASRLEGITKEYHADIIVGEATRNAVSDIVFREFDKVRVKGKDEAVAIYEPLGLQGQISKARLDETKLYGQFLRLYRAQDWDQAELQLFNLQKMAPDNALYSQTLPERIAHLRGNPPGAGWDGVFTFKTK